MVRSPPACIHTYPKYSSAFNKWHKSYLLCAQTKEDMKAWIEIILRVKTQLEVSRESELLPLGHKSSTIATIPIEHNTIRKLVKSKIEVHVPMVITKIIAFLNRTSINF